MSGAARTDFADRRDAFSAASSYSMVVGVALVAYFRSSELLMLSLVHSEPKSRLGLFSDSGRAHACQNAGT